MATEQLELGPALYDRGQMDLGGRIGLCHGCLQQQSAGDDDRRGQAAAVSLFFGLPHTLIPMAINTPVAT